MTFDEFMKVDLRIAKVLEAKEHPNADKLFVLKVEVGEDEKQIVAGIRNSYEADELVGKNVVLVNNLEPATIRGEESNGMLLAASVDGKPIILSPEKDVPSGTQVR